MIDWIVEHPWRAGILGVFALGLVWMCVTDGWRLTTRRLVHAVVLTQLACVPVHVVSWTLGDPWPWAAAPLSLAALVFGKTPLGALDFVALQWFGVRLEVSQCISGASIAEVRERAERAARNRGRWWSLEAMRGPDVKTSWKLARWVWPLTGWWSPYRWIARRS